MNRLQHICWPKIKPGCFEKSLAFIDVTIGEFPVTTAEGAVKECIGILNIFTILPTGDGERVGGRYELFKVEIPPLLTA